MAAATDVRKIASVKYRIQLTDAIHTAGAQLHSIRPAMCTQLAV